MTECRRGRSHHETGSNGETVERLGRMKGFDPRRATASPRHAEVAGRYQTAYTLVEFAAAVAFLIGSAFFFYEDLAIAADWLFLAGSFLFAVRPTVAVAQQIHLSRIPLNPMHRHDHYPSVDDDMTV